MSVVDTEAGLEDVVLEYLALEGLGVVYGPDIAPGEAGAERSDYRMWCWWVVFVRRWCG